MSELFEGHYKAVVSGVIRGELVPFLGAGVNLCSRPQSAAWHAAQSIYLPNGTELAAHLAQDFGYAPQADLARVSEEIAMLQGLGPLYGALHGLFNRDYPPTPVHRFLAQIPRVLGEKGYSIRRYPLVVTTNYDDLMERAFEEAGQKFDTVTYLADGEPEQCGKFMHRSPEGSEKVIEIPNEYRELSLEKRPVLLKIHGAVKRNAPQGDAEIGGTDSSEDSYVIPEDHYIEYLTRSNISSLVPASLAGALKTSHILFLGYGLRDWNLRVMLHRILQRGLNWQWWAILMNPDEVDKKFWMKRNVEILEMPLDAYIRELESRLDQVPGRLAAAEP